MGAVYQAWDDELLVAVAIKVILPDQGSDPGTRHDLEQRFKRELVLARQISHKNIVRIHDIGDVDGTKYITMSFIEGETLAAKLRRESALAVQEVVAIGRQIAHGLAAAHDVGVIHRDLKPENIMITPDGQAVIMDFGIARTAARGQTQTMAGTVLGTLEYMAPEQASAQPVDQRTDLYAFGLILYDMLLGRTRLAGRDNPMLEIMERLQHAPPPAGSKRAEIPPALDAIVTRCVQTDPAARFESTAAVVEALDALAPDGHARLQASGTTAAAPAISPAASVAPARGRRMWIGLGVGGAAVVASAVAGVMYFRNPPAAETGPRQAVSVLIADFENKTGDSVFDGVVEQALGLGIESASFVSAYPRRDALRTASALKIGSSLSEETARLVAQREGVGVVIAGAVEPNGSGAYRITTRALEPGGQARTLYSIHVDADGKAQVLEAVGTLAGRVREALGDTSVPSGAALARETFTAASLEAARAYAHAQELQNAGKRMEAIDQYLQALKLDPDFGRAYSGLAAQYANIGRTQDAQSNYDKALSLTHRMTEREKFRTRGSYYLFARKPQQAMDEYAALLKTYPGDDVGHTNSALAQFYLRNLNDAMERGRRAAEMQPNNVGRRSNLALYALYAGQFETAMKEADGALALNPATLKAFVARGLAQLALGRTADAASTFDALMKLSPAGASFATMGLADIALYEGRLSDAVARLEAGIAADAQDANAAGVAAKRLALAEARLARGETALAIKEARTAAAASDADVTRAGAGLLLARAGDAKEAEVHATQLEGRLENDPQAYGKLIRAEMALAANQGRAAVAHAREAQKLADTWLGRTILGRAYLATNAFPDAQGEFENALKRQGEATAVFLDDVPSYRLFAPVHYYLGVAREGVKSPQAAESFKTFLDIKKNGDETGGLVAEAKRRLQ